MCMKRISLALALAVMAVACTDAPAVPTRLTDKATTSPEEGGHLDGLTLTLRLKEGVFAPGETIRADLVVENSSGVTIIDPYCFLHSHHRAVIPQDDPFAELWQVNVLDCGRRLRMKDGFRRVYEASVDLRATDKMGEPLDEGEYLASFELPGFSERLSVPVALED